MAMTKCKECGNEVSSAAKTCPSCGKKLKAGLFKKMLYVVGGIFGGIFVLGIIGGIVGGGDEASSTSSVKSSSVKSSIPLPADQKAFIDTVNSFVGEYEAAPNALKKSAIRTKRSSAIKAVLNGNLRIRNWVGTLKKMDTNSEGKAIISIALPGSKLRVQTWNNALSDLSANTLIEQHTQLFNDISELTVGDNVVFTGNFISGDDYIGEQSITENGAMTSPEFTFSFSNIKKM